MKKTSYRRYIFCVCVGAMLLGAGCVTKPAKAASALERGAQSNNRAQSELDRAFQK